MSHLSTVFPPTRHHFESFFVWYKTMGSYELSALLELQNPLNITLVCDSFYDDLIATSRNKTYSPEN